jgi:hypothetical protein
MDNLTLKQIDIITHFGRNAPPRRWTRFFDDVARRLGGDHAHPTDMEVTAACIAALKAA